MERYYSVWGTLSRHESFFFVTWPGKLGNLPLLWTGLQKRQTSSFAPQHWRTWCLPILPEQRSSKWFPPFCCMDFSSRSTNALWLFYSLGRELIFLLVCCRIKCYIALIHLSLLFPTKYSLLGYNLLNNLMCYKKWGIIYELTPRQIL